MMLSIFPGMTFKRIVQRTGYGALLMLACFLLAGCPPHIADRNLKVEKAADDSATLSWKPAFDGDGHSMLYMAYSSTSPKLNTVAEIETNGAPRNDYAADLTSVEITGLEPGTKYYFNVIVKCAADGNKRAYRMTETGGIRHLVKGELYIEEVDKNSDAFDWTDAFDPDYPDAEIRYRLSYSADGENFIPVNSDWLPKAEASKAIEGLEADSFHKFRLTARSDHDGETTYNTAMAYTLPPNAAEKMTKKSSSPFAVVAVPAATPNSYSLSSSAASSGGEEYGSWSYLLEMAVDDKITASLSDDGIMMSIFKSDGATRMMSKMIEWGTVGTGVGAVLGAVMNHHKDMQRMFLRIDALVRWLFICFYR